MIAQVGVGLAPEFWKQRLTRRVEAEDRRRVQVVVCGLSHAVVGHVGDLERQIVGQRALQREVPALHVRLAELFVDYVVHRVGGVGNDPVREKHRQGGRRETGR